MRKPPTPVRFNGLTEVDVGSWMNDDTTEIVSIYRERTEHDPEEEETDENKPVYFAEKEADEWVYWTGTRYREVGMREDGRVLFEKTPIDEVTVARHRAYVEWHERMRQN